MEHVWESIWMYGLGRSPGYRQSASDISKELGKEAKDISSILTGFT